MKLKLVTFTVRDIEKSMPFYREILGLKVVNEIKMDHLHLVFFGTESDVQIELVCYLDKPYTANTSSNISVGIEYDNVQAIVEKLMDNGYKINGPFSPNPNTTFYFAEDLDGFIIQLIAA